MIKWGQFRLAKSHPTRKGNEGRRLKAVKRKPEIIEGSEAFTRFDALVGSVLSVPRSVIEKREAEYKKKAALNPRKRGPKPKRKQS